MEQKTSVWIFCLALFLAAAVCQGHAAVKIFDSDEYSVDLYGFFKLDATVQDNPTNSLLAPRYALPGDGSTTSLTAMNSRFGLKFSGLKITGGWKVGGNLEFDLFDGSSRNQMKFRARHAYLTLSKGSTTFLAGQYWDLFSPIGPTTLMTNGYLWNTGNLGFRRAQIRYSVSGQGFDLALSLSDPTIAGAISTGMPLAQARLGITLGGRAKTKLGVSAAYGRDRHSAPGLETDVDILGLSLDWIVPATNNWVLKGEFGFGKNLSVFLSRADVVQNAAADEFAGMKVMSFWTEILYTAKKTSFWLGYAFENLRDDDQVTAGGLQDTSCILAGVQYHAGGKVSFGLEYTRFLSKYNQVSDKASANQFILSVIYGF